MTHKTQAFHVRGRGLQLGGGKGKMEEEKWGDGGKPVDKILRALFHLFSVILSKVCQQGHFEWNVKIVHARLKYHFPSGKSCTSWCTLKPNSSYIYIADDPLVFPSEFYSLKY